MAERMGLRSSIRPWAAMWTTRNRSGSQGREGLLGGRAAQSGPCGGVGEEGGDLLDLAAGEGQAQVAMLNSG